MTAPVQEDGRGAGPAEGHQQPGPQQPPGGLPGRAGRRGAPVTGAAAEPGAGAGRKPQAEARPAAGARGPAVPAARRSCPPAGGKPLPPGQHLVPGWPVLHYGPVPRFRPDRWDLRVFGATESGAGRRWDWPALAALPRCQVTADFHCVTKFTVRDVCWEGIAAAEILLAAPPAPGVTHVMVWADYGYSANLRIGDFADEQTLLATRRDGADLAPEHGFPLRLVVPRLYGWKSVKWVRAIEYMTADRRGFWEERGYHNRADPWQEQRYSYQEKPGDGPSQ